VIVFLGLAVGSASAGVTIVDVVNDRAGSMFTFFGPLSVPTINNSGTIAFSAITSSGGGAFTVNYPATGNAVTTVVTDSDGVSVASSPTINDSGTLAFVGIKATTAGIYTRVAGGPITTIAENSDGFDQYSAASINASGQVSFWGRNTATAVDSINIGDGVSGPQTIATMASGDFRFFNDQTTINAAGQVGFLGQNSDFSFSVVVGTPGDLQPLATTMIPGGYNGFGGLPPVLNDVGAAAYFASTSTGAQINYVAPGGATSVYVATSDTGFEGLGQMSLDNNGRIYFIGLYQGKIGLYSGTDPVNDLVFAIGDSLFGSTLAGFSFGPDSVNDHGQIGFQYLLDDGTRGIAFASLGQPASVPEPASLALMGLGLLAVVVGPRLARRTARPTT
jgi:hypothetical protein